MSQGNNPYGGPPGGQPGWGQPQGQQGPAQGYAPAPGQYPAPQQQQQYPMQPGQGAPMQQGGYGPQQGYPMQQQQPYGAPMQHGGQPGYYGQQPINIVVQNNVGGGMGGLVRIGNKSRMTAALLAFFVGVWGVHKFYLNKPVIGILYFFTAGFFFIGPIIDTIVLLMMSDQEFDLKYNSMLAR